MYEHDVPITDFDEFWLQRTGNRGVVGKPIVKSDL